MAETCSVRERLRLVRLTRDAPGADCAPGQSVGDDLALAQMALFSVHSIARRSDGERGVLSEDRVRNAIRNFNADGFGSISLKTTATAGRGSRWSAAGDQEDHQVLPG